MAKVVVVTGASSGIGLETCKKLAADGFSVVGTVRSAQKGEATVKSVREAFTEAKICCPVLEMGKKIDATATKAAVKELGGNLVGLVNNAGLAGDLPWEEVTDREVGQRIMDTNFFALQAITKELEPLLAEEGGFIVNVSSGAAFYNMQKMSCEALKKLQTTGEESLDSVAHSFMERYRDVNINIRERDEITGFHLQAYGFSKVLVNRLTELHAAKWPKHIVTACSPGFCRTPMTSTYDSGAGLRTSAQGAEIVMRASKGPTGLFFSADEEHDNKPLMVV